MAPINFGNLYAIEGRYEPAVEQTQKALRLNPDNVIGYDNLAQYLAGAEPVRRHTQNLR